MNKLRKYSAPVVLDDLTLELEAEILGASAVVEETIVESAGQQVETVDFSDPAFNQQWE
ncbi:MAG: hypothetical protein K6E35_02535 [Bacteroidales bacterium]|nr:hypothetical protein [Bacteroidales bacterium]